MSNLIYDLPRVSADEIQQEFFEQITYALPGDYLKYLVELNGFFSEHPYMNHYLKHPVEIGTWFGFYTWEQEEFMKKKKISFQHHELIYGNYRGDYESYGHERVFPDKTLPDYFICIARGKTSRVLMSLYPDEYGQVFVLEEPTTTKTYREERLKHPRQSDKDLLISMGYQHAGNSFSDLFHAVATDL